MANELHEAAADLEKGFEQVRTLIDVLGLDKDTKHTECDSTPIEFAAQEGSFKTVNFLLDKGASLDAAGKQRNLLDWSLYNSLELQSKLAQRLLQGNLFERFNDGTSYLHMVAYAGDYNKVQEILTREPDLVNTLDAQGRSPIYWAAARSNFAIVANLLSRTSFSSSKEFHISYLKGTLVASDVSASCYQEFRELSEVERLLDQGYALLQQLYELGVSDQNTLGAFILKGYRLASAYCDVQLFEESSKLLTKIEAIWTPKLDSETRTLLQERFGSYRMCVEAKQGLFTAITHLNCSYQEVPSDGNCFFHAVLEQLQVSEPITDMQLRTRLVEHLCVHREDYKPFINTQFPDDEETYFPSYGEYLDAMSKSGEFVDHPVILAFSREYKATVVIVQNTDAITVIKQQDAAQVIYLGHNVFGQHYVPVKPVDPGVFTTVIEQEDLDDFNPNRVDRGNTSEQDLRRNTGFPFFNGNGSSSSSSSGLIPSDVNGMGM